jgi:putative tryptophan/tyrosine transport system ATP-binding protein
MSIELNSVSVIYNKNTLLERPVLENASLSLSQGEFIALIGNNGSGKSTLARIIAGETKITSGSIKIDGVDCTNMPSFSRSKFISRVFQDPTKGTAPHMTVLENLIFANKRGDIRTLSMAARKQDKDFFRDKLKSMNTGLEDKLSVPVFMLSGGQRQLLSLFMAISKPSKVLLLDEHTAALDPEAAKFIMSLTHQILKDHNITTIMITHDMNELEYCDQVYGIIDKKIIKIDSNDLLNK